MEEKVLNALKKSAEPLKAGDVAISTGLDKKEVDKTIKNLVKQGKVGSPKRCFYSAL